MKIGDLAKETGVSVRTLHFYEEKGLLTPSMRSESGHRIYNNGDIVRLHRILALKRLNLSLEEIRNTLGKSSADVRTLLDRNTEELESEIGEKTETLRVLQGTRRFLDCRDDLALTELTDMINDISLAQRHLTETQLSALEERERLLGDDEINKILNEVPKMKAAIKEAMARNLPPSDPGVLNTVTRWMEISDALIGDNEDVEAALLGMLDKHPDILERHQLGEDVMSFMKEARNHLESTG